MYALPIQLVILILVVELNGIVESQIIVNCTKKVDRSKEFCLYCKKQG